jgi:hypothetical protein
MKEWDKERIARYFDTTDLWKLVNDSTHTKEAEPQILKVLLPKSKLKWNRKVERARRVLSVRKRSSLR